MALDITAMMTLSEKPEVTTPRDVPEAGGCSVSVTTMRKMESPTANAYTTVAGRKAEWGIQLQRDPAASPTRWPPTTFLGLAVMLLGMANTINTVEPREAMITACCKLKNRNTMNTARVAKRLWNT